MEAKFILIAVILPVIASQGINKGKNSMLKSINFFYKIVFLTPPPHPERSLNTTTHPLQLHKLIPLKKCNVQYPPPPNNHPGIFKESESYIKYLHGFVLFFYFIEQCLWTTQQPMNVENPPSSPVDLRSS